MRVTEMIKALQDIEKEHGDLEIYEYTNMATVAKYEGYSLRPRVDKIYSQKWEHAAWMRDELSNGELEEADEELYDVDLTKPIVKGVLI